MEDVQMFNEREFTERVESANVDDFAALLRQPSADEEKTLKVHLGEERYQRIRGLALRQSIDSNRSTQKGNVIVIPGAMGSELSVADRSVTIERLWLAAAKVC